MAYHIDNATLFSCSMQEDTAQKVTGGPYIQLKRDSNDSTQVMALINCRHLSTDECQLALIQLCLANAITNEEYETALSDIHYEKEAVRMTT